MKNDEVLNEPRSGSSDDFHFGKMIEVEARRKGISSRQLAETINRYQHNEAKIFKRADMDACDIVKILMFRTSL